MCVLVQFNVYKHQMCELIAMQFAVSGNILGYFDVFRSYDLALEKRVYAVISRLPRRKLRMQVSLEVAPLQTSGHF